VGSEDEVAKNPVCKAMLSFIADFRGAKFYNNLR
jgi:hypothetical protein